MDNHQSAETTQAPPPALSVEPRAKLAQTESTEQRAPAHSVSLRLENTACNSIRGDGAEHVNAHVTTLERVPGETHEPFATDSQAELGDTRAQASEMAVSARAGSAQPRAEDKVRSIKDEELGLRVLHDWTDSTPHSKPGRPVE